MTRFETLLILLVALILALAGGLGVYELSPQRHKNLNNIGDDQ